ncbi:hypothetical protein [Natrononativus amylolyticus]|uniref:hypothetical protein n=1 Tax=Natrononativus amylolyticus TaxID=2963434 RepID=UPI0020CD823B|nr:hypothetical protein [Natrononativus amylolyticus]
MTGLKSGSGDDLWGDDEETADEEPSEAPQSSTEEAAASGSSDDESGVSGAETATNGARDQGQSYLVRRAIQDKSVQFERDERLTFFVHDDVVEGERDLITDLESTLGRDVPKFDVREAVYRAALNNPDDVLEELLAMGYSLGEE